MQKVVKALCDALTLAVKPIGANASFFFSCTRSDA